MPSTTCTQTFGLNAWVTRLATGELPVLGSVMRDINRLTRASDASANELAEVILRDASLTAKVLRIANSVHFNPAGEQEMTTISRAVLKLGFRSIRAISLSVMLIDSLLKRGSRERMLEWLARGFHAAVQAEQLAAIVEPGLKEEVFLGALLMHVGEMALWSCRGDQLVTLEQALGERVEDAAVERELLGASLRDITRALAEAWEMGEPLRQALALGEAPSMSARLIRCGDQISLASEGGWDSEAMVAVTAEAAKLTGRSRDEAQAMLIAGAEEAAGVAISFGANKLCNYIPTAAEAVPVRKAKADPQLQLSILRELAAMIHERVDANTLFQMVVEGVHRGVGLERVAVCLLDPRKKIVAAKYALGDEGRWREALQFDVRSAELNLAAHALFTRQLLWLRPTTLTRFRHLLDDPAQTKLEVANCLMAPLYAGSREVGLLIADRGPDGDAIQQDQYDSFSHFAQQTNMGLAMLASQAGQRKG